MAGQGILAAGQQVKARAEEARRAALADAKADVASGQNLSDTLGGYGMGAYNLLGGGIYDALGNIGGYLGNEEFAADTNLQSDELYNRAGNYFREGLGRGNEFVDQFSIPLNYKEEERREQLLNEAELQLSQGEKEFLKNANLIGTVDAGVDSSLQSGKPNISFTRKEGESKEDFKNRIIKEQSVTAGAPASSYDVVPSELTGQSASELQSTIDALTASGGKGRGQTNEQQGERAAFAKEQARKNDPMGDYSGEEPTVDLFMQAMADGNVAEGKEQPKAESREDLLEKYKQEFAEATGIDVSGKPDNSQALMAMGLSMMKNRAGKGFNIGNMLSAVGDAGEKAMPYVTKAASEAKAATAAAGKYALQKITNNENAEKAVAAATLKAQREFTLELMKLDNAKQVAGINSSGKANKIENVSKLQPLGKDGGVTFSVGNIQGESKFANAAADVGSVTRAWDKYSRGQSILQEMKTSLDKIESADSTALDGIYESVISSLDKLGISDAKKVFEEGVGPRASFNINRQSMINGFKRLLLQESQVSDLDLRTMTASFGNADIWSSIPASQMAIDNMMIYFGGKKKTLEHPLTIFSDRDFYTSDAEFDKVMKHLEKQGIGGFGGVSNGASIPTASNVDGVSTVRLG